MNISIDMKFVFFWSFPLTADPPPRRIFLEFIFQKAFLRPISLFYAIFLSFPLKSFGVYMLFKAFSLFFLNIFFHFFSIHFHFFPSGHSPSPTAVIFCIKNLKTKLNKNSKIWILSLHFDFFKSKNLGGNTFQ